MNVAETAKKALEILDSDGWCQGSTEIREGSIALMNARMSGKDYRIGSHCLAGAWNKALSRDCGFLGDTTSGVYAPLAKVIREQYPDFTSHPYGFDSLRVVTFNDLPDTTEADIRAILEKLAVEE